MRRVTVTADDFGLCRGVTNTIWEAVEHGAVRSLSVMGNGEDIEHAAHLAQSRKDVRVHVHINLTEGLAVSPVGSLPHLTDARGYFRRGVLGLWMAYLIASPRERASMVREVRDEVRAQYARVKAAFDPGMPLGVNGHQHVHMLPFVFDEVVALDISHVRISDEPFFTGGAWRMHASMHGIGRFVLSLLSVSARRKAPARTVACDNRVIGILYSGQQTDASVRAGVASTTEDAAIEIIVHPGSADPGELERWEGNRADTAWHYAEARRAERAIVSSPTWLSPEPPYRPSQAGLYARFIISGGAATLINMGTLFALVHFFEWWYVYAVFASWTLSFAVSFSLQKFWTFRSPSLRAAHRQAFFYLLNNLLGIAFDAIGIFVLVEYLGVWYLLAQFVLLALIAVWNFFVSRALFGKVSV